MSQTQLPPTRRPERAPEDVTRGRVGCGHAGTCWGREKHHPPAVTRWPRGVGRCPMVEVTKNYVFHGRRPHQPAGAVRWAPPVDRLPLHVQPQWDEGCPSCSCCRQLRVTTPCTSPRATPHSWWVARRRGQIAVPRRMGGVHLVSSLAPLQRRCARHHRRDAGLDEYNDDSVTKLKEWAGSSSTRALPG